MKIEIMSDKDCPYCGNPLRHIVLLGDLDFDICDICVKPFLEMYFEPFYKNKMKGHAHGNK